MDEQLEDRIDPFDDDEIQSILPHLHPQAQNYVIVALWTGLRVEELIELQWKDVDFQKGEIRVRRARTRGEAKVPKTSGQVGREITLLEPSRAALAAQRAYTYLNRGHVFHNPRTDAPYSEVRLYVATLERAAFEMMYLVPKHQSYEEALQVMESLTSLRPQVIQQLLENCTSVKTKRLFMHAAERLNHQWLKRLDLSKVDFGSGRRTIHAGGHLDNKYDLVVADPVQG